MRDLLKEWIDSTGDSGQVPETWENYLANMRIANAGMLSLPDKAERAREREVNMMLMKKWRNEGK